MTEGQEVPTQTISPILDTSEQPVETNAIRPITAVENSNIAKLNVFLSQFNISLDKLPKPLLNQCQNLIDGKNNEGTEMTDKEYQEGFSDFIANIKNSATELKLSPENIEAIDKISKLVGSGEISPQDIVTDLKGYLENAPEKIGLKPEEQNAAIEELMKVESELKKPKPQMNKEILKLGFEKILKFLKMLGAAILGLFGISIWRAFGEAMKGSAKQQ